MIIKYIILKFSLFSFIVIEINLGCMETIWEHFVIFEEVN